MATVKNFGLKGVGNQVQFGKSGGKLDFGVNTGSEFSVTASDGSTAGQLNIAITPTAVSHATSKQYVDSVVTGLDVKASVLVATVAGDVGGFTYTSVSDGGAAPVTPWTNVVAPVFDGVTLVNLDRVLIKDSADAKGNGIFIYDSGASTFVRTTDADNTPGNEVSGGMFTFVEIGATQADNGYVMDSPTGNAVLGTSELNFSQFSGAGQITAGDGLVKLGNVIDVVGSTTIIANPDSLEVNSSSTSGELLISGGTPGTAATFGAVNLSNDNAVTNLLDLDHGGLNVDASSFPVGSIGLFQNGSAVGKVDAVATGNVIISQGTTTDPIYGKVGLTTHVSGILPIANGGTNKALTLSNGGIVWTDADSMEVLAAGTNGQLLQSGGAGTPNWTTSTYPDGGIADRSILITAAANAVTALTVTPNSNDQLLLWDDAADNFAFVNADTVGTSFGIVNGDSGTANAVGTADTINLVGATNGGITTFAADGSPDSVTFALTIIDLADGSAETVALDTEIALNLTGDAATVTARKFTFTDVVDDLNIPHGSSLNALGGVYRIALDDGGNDYVTRLIDFSVVAGDEGISVVDGEGLLGNPTIGLDIVGLTLDTIVVGTDNLVAYNGVNNVKITAAELVGDMAVELNIPFGFTSNGILARTGADTYTELDVVASPVASEEGIIITNPPSGGSGNDIQVGLDIEGLTLTTILVGSDKLVVFDGTNNRKVNVSELVNDSVIAFKTVVADTGANAIADISTDTLNLKGATNGGIVTVGADNDEIITFGLTIEDLTAGGATLDRADLFAVGAGGEAANTLAFKYTIADVVDDLDIPHGQTATGLTVRIATADAGSDYTSRAIAFSVVAGDEGLSVVNGDGVSGNPTVGLDIVGLTTNTVTTGSDFLVLFDGVNNRKITVDTFIANGDQNLFETFASDSGSTTADTTTDTLTVSGGAGISTEIVGDVLTITNTEPNVNNPDQDLWLTITANTGSTAADSLTDSLAIVGEVTAGLEGIITSITADIVSVGLNIDGLAADNVASVALNAGGTGYAVSEVLTLVGGTGTFATITVDTVGTVLSQDETDFDGTGTNGTFAGGTVYVALDEVTYTDGTVLRVDVEVAGVVTEFTVITSSTSGNTNLAALVQASTTSVGGTGFVPTLGLANQAVFGFTLTTAGNYTVDPTPLTANLVTTGGSGTLASFDITMDGVSGTDTLVIFDGVNNRQTTIDDIIANTVDQTRITDGVNSFVDTDEIAGQVTINTTNALDDATQLLATFKTAAGGTTITDANFLFTNEDSVDTGGNDEIQICAAGGADNIDVRIKPRGTGKVFLGEAGTDATISSSDGTTGENLTILAGDGSSGDGGIITITPGDGSTGTDGVVCITDADSVNVMCFEGASGTIAVSYLTTTNAPTGGEQSGGTAPEIKAVSSDSNVDIGFLPKGTGVLSVSGTTTYEDNVTDDDDIPNKAFVDAADAAVLSGSVSSFKFTVNLGINGDTDPALSTIPASATVIRVSINVTTLNTTSTLTIGTTGAPAAYADDTTNDPSATGLYNVDLQDVTVGALRAVVAAQTGAVGSAVVIVEYKND